MRQEFGADQEAELYCCMAEGVIQQDLGNAAAAEESLEKASQLYQSLGGHSNPEAMLEMAQTRGQLGDRQGAEALIRELVRNNHSEEQLLRQVGSVVEGLGLEKDSEKFIGEIRGEIVRLNNQGVELAREGRLKEAVGLFEEAVERMPGNRVVNLNAARVLIMHMQRHGVEPARLDRVRQSLEKVSVMEAENPALRRVVEMYRELTSQPTGASGSP
jgi:tetratricopeptide (TPR) repeat protein